MPHVLLNRLTAKPGQRQRVVEILLESGELVDDNPACLLYLVGESTDDPNPGVGDRPVDQPGGACRGAEGA